MLLKSLKRLKSYKQNQKLSKEAALAWVSQKAETETKAYRQYMWSGIQGAGSGPAGCETQKIHESVTAPSDSMMHPKDTARCVEC